MLIKSPHQQRVELFMAKAEQEVPYNVVIPSEEVRLLRAMLILEEAIETIEALGMRLNVTAKQDDKFIIDTKENTITVTLVTKEMISLSTGHQPDLYEIADGCADLSVVTIGTLSACGIVDTPLLEEVDAANLRKFGPGATRRSDGKWIKPPNFVGPDIKRVLKEQGWEG